MLTKEFKVEGMSCHHCVNAVNIELEVLDINSKEVNVGSVIVTYDETKLDESKIAEAIEKAGYRVI